MKKRLIFALLILLLPSFVYATTYYVDATNGDDTNSGTSESTPWKTIARVNADTRRFNPSDQILFKRGETWREQLIVTSYGNSSLTFGAYGTGPRPKIMGSEQITGWANQGGNIWRASCTSEPGSGHGNGPVWFVNANGDGKTHWGTKDTSPTAEYEWYWDSNYLYVYSPTDPDTRYDAIEAAMRDNGVKLDLAEHAHVKDLEICYTARPGLYGGGCDNVVVDGCHIHHNGIGGLGDNIFWMGEGWTIKNNILHDGPAHNIQHFTSNANGDIIENNICYDAGHVNIDVKHVGPSGSMANQVIRYNLVYMTSDWADSPFGSAVNAGIGVLADMGYYADNTQIYGNILVDYWTWGIYLERGVDGATIYNNVIYGRHPSSANISGCHGAIMLTGWNGRPPRNVSIKNNIIAGDLLPSDSGIVIWYDNGLSMIDECDNNLFYITTGHFIRNNAGAGSQTYYDAGDWEAWKTLSGFDENSKWNQDPKFVNPSSFDFHLEPTSPCIDAGTDVGLIQDFEGNPVPQGSAPDIGAFESEESAVTGTYYVDATAGNDAWSGTSVSTPWKTISKVNSETFEPGDQILFKRGETWRETLNVPSSGAPGNPIVFGAYGTGAKPKIIGSEQITGWSVYSGNQWRASSVSKPGWPGEENGPVWFIGQDGIIHWGKEETVLANVDAEYDWYWDSSGYLITYSPTDPDSRYLSVEAATRRNSISRGSSSYIAIQDIELAYTYGACLRIDIGSLHHWTIDGNTVHHCGEIVGGGGSHAWAAHGIYCEAPNSIIKNNLVYECGNHGIYVLGAGNPNYNVIVEHNEVYNCYHTGIDIMGLGGAIVQNITVRYNKVYTTSAYNSPTVTMEAIYFSSDGWNNGKMMNSKAYYNIVYNLINRGIEVGQNCHNIEVYNNVAYGTNPIADAGMSTGFWVEGAGSITNITLKNNIAMDTRDACFFIGTTAHLKEVDNNFWYQSDNSIPYVILNSPWNKWYYDDQAAYQSATGLDIHGLWDVNPIFVNPSNNDFHLQSISPAIDAGANIGLTKDFEGNPVPQGVGYDIGAYEFQGVVACNLGDLNCDGVVDISDLTIVATNFGLTSGFDIRADTDNNNVIDIFDIVFVASRFT